MRISWRMAPQSGSQHSFASVDLELDFCVVQGWASELLPDIVQNLHHCVLGSFNLSVACKDLPCHQAEIAQRQSKLQSTALREAALLRY